MEKKQLFNVSIRWYLQKDFGLRQNIPKLGHILNMNCQGLDVWYSFSYPKDAVQFFFLIDDRLFRFSRQELLYLRVHLEFVVQNDGTYPPEITRETCKM